MAKYILIARACGGTNERLMKQLASKQYPDLETAEMAVTETLGHDYWELLGLSRFCDRWNDSSGWYGSLFDSCMSFAAILEIGA
jgi:hypothetical protein|nr:MAG TPA: hypothetical protein [Herelleviridae sp.]